jgi:hypothetical protein
MADVKVIDHGLDRIIAETMGLAAAGVKFGIQSGSGSHEGTDLLDIAIYNEYGTERIPARPFMRDFANKNNEVLGTAMERQAEKIMKGMPIHTAMMQLGEFAQKHQKAHIVRAFLWAKPNAPSTIKQKGSSKPLVDTGALANAVRYEVLK